VATFDISAAYQLTPIQPDQQQHLCVMWQDLIYAYRAIMFGLSSSAGVFGCIADMLVSSALLKWVDNFFVICLQSWSEQEFMDLTAAIGVPWSIKKMRPLSVTQRYIGFN
jgi:hypothetical protein